MRYFEDDNISVVDSDNHLFLQSGVKNIEIGSGKAALDDKFTGFAAGELNFHDITDEEVDFEVVSAVNRNDVSLKPQKEFSA